MKNASRRQIKQLSRLLTEDPDIILESTQDEQLIELINHEYSTLPQRLKDKFTRLLADGELPEHNRSFLLKVAKGVQAAIAIEGDYTADTGVLAVVDGYDIRGAVLLLGVEPHEAERAYKQFSDRLKGRTESSEFEDFERDPDAWKQDRSQIDNDDDVSFLCKDGDWDLHNISQVKVYYRGAIKRRYEINKISWIHTGPPSRSLAKKAWQESCTHIIYLGDDEFEIEGLQSLVKSKLRITGNASTDKIQDVINKYGMIVEDMTAI